MKGHLNQLREFRYRMGDKVCFVRGGHLSKVE